MTVSRPVALLAAVLAAGACRPAEASRLAGGAGSIRELGARYLEALARRDTAGMHALRVTEAEHNEVLWPEFPASGLNMPVEVAWQNVERASWRKGARIAARFGGVSHKLRGVHCRKGVTQYASFRVHGDCWVTMRPPDGPPFEAKLFGSIVEMDGRYKIIGILAD